MDDGECELQLSSTGSRFLGFGLAEENRENDSEMSEGLLNTSTALSPTLTTLTALHQSESHSSTQCVDFIDCDSTFQLIAALQSGDTETRRPAESEFYLRRSEDGMLSLLCTLACLGRTACKKLFIKSQQQHGEDVHNLSPSLLSFAQLLVGSSTPEEEDASQTFAFLRSSDESSLASPRIATPVLATPAEPYNELQLLAAILTKQLVRDTWDDRRPNEKELVKRTLLSHAVLHPDQATRRHLHLAISMVASQEQPIVQQWSQLFPVIERNLTESRRSMNPNGMQCTLELLQTMANLAECPNSLYSDILNNDNGLQDGLLYIAQGMRQFDFTKRRHESTIAASCRCLSLSIYRTCLAEVFRRGHFKEVAKSILPHLEAWIELLVEIFQEASVASVEDLDIMKTTLGSLQCLKVFCSPLVDRHTLLAAKTTSAIRKVLQYLIQILETYFATYQNMVINEPQGEFEEDLDGGPQALVSEVCDVIIFCANSRRTRCLLETDTLLDDMLRVLLPYMQLSDSQCEIWLESPREFLWEEEEAVIDPYSLRRGGERLLLTLLDVMAKRSIKSGLACAADLVKTSEEQNWKNITTWWKYLEVAFWLAGLLADDQKAFEAFYQSPSLDLVVRQMGKTMDQDNAPQFLRARSFCTASKLHKFLHINYAGDVKLILLLSAKALQLNQSYFIRVAACRSFEKFIALSADQELKSEIVVGQNVVPNIINLIEEASEGFVPCAFDVMTALVRHCPSTLVEVQNSFLPFLLTLWSKCRVDPLTHVFFQSFIHTACTSSQTLKAAIEAKLMPVLLQTIRDTAETALSLRPEGLHELSSTLDVFNLLIKESNAPISDDTWNLFNCLLQVAAVTDECSLITGVCETIAIVVTKHAERLRAEKKVDDLLMIAAELLKTNLDDRAIIFVGPLLRVLLRHFGRDIHPSVIKQFFSAFLIRIAAATIPALRMSLLLVLCRLVCEGCCQMCDALRDFEVNIDGDMGLVTGFEAFTTLLITALKRHYGLPHSKYGLNVSLLSLIELLKYQLSALGNLGTFPNGGAITEILRILIKGFFAANSRSKKAKASLRRGLANKRKQMELMTSPLAGGSRATIRHRSSVLGGDESPTLTETNRDRFCWTQKNHRKDRDRERNDYNEEDDGECIEGQGNIVSEVDGGEGIESDPTVPKSCDMTQTAQSFYPASLLEQQLSGDNVVSAAEVQQRKGHSQQSPIVRTSSGRDTSSNFKESAAQGDENGDDSNDGNSATDSSGDDYGSGGESGDDIYSSASSRSSRSSSSNRGVFALEELSDPITSVDVIPRLLCQFECLETDGGLYLKGLSPRSLEVLRKCMTASRQATSATINNVADKNSSDEANGPAENVGSLEAGDSDATGLCRAGSTIQCGEMSGKCGGTAPHSPQSKNDAEVELAKSGTS